MSIEKTPPTPIVDFGDYKGNHLWIKREDFIPFSFGGNKARKALLFFEEIEKGEYDCVVTYGSSSSNHCRVVANACCSKKIGCYIISPKEEQETTFNSQMMRMFGAEITVVSVDDVHKTIEDKIKQLMIEGKRPYFIEGGGHGNLGTEAYFQCYQEIRKQEKEMGVFFDYIFLASGTGTTQAGLVCGKLVYHDNRKIVGISIARKNPRGRSVVKDSIVSYLNNRIPSNHIEESLIFLDDYTEGYGQKDIKVDITINEMLKTFGIPLDATYTGKAFWGMDSYLTEIFEKNILFLHTGGTPLFFDYLRGITE